MAQAVDAQVGIVRLGASAQEAGFRDALFEQAAYFFAAQIGTDGAVQFTTTLRLPRNALVETLDVKVKAARATGVLASAVAQVRAGPSTDTAVGAGLTAIVDFGTPRTVTAISVPSAFQIVRVQTWNGAQFASPPAYEASWRAGIFQATGRVSTNTYVALSSEPRTERLSISVVGSTDSAVLIPGIILILPDAPSDLELRIDGRAPAWTHPGPVLPGDEAALTAGAWNKDSERIVHLAPAFAGLTGDPTASGEQEFELKLTSRAPGLLNVSASSRTLKYIRRAVFNGQTETTLEFAEEGAIDLVTKLEPPQPPAIAQQLFKVPDLPTAAAIHEIRLTLEADLGETRTLPPVGPNDFPAVDLTLDPQRAVLIRLRPGSGLEKLTGVRVPLAPAEEGAEARVVLWTNREPSVAEPVAAMAAATSEPQVLAAAADGVPRWTTFVFPAPVPIDSDNPPWAAVAVTRGRAVLSLAANAAPADPLDAQVFRLGPSAGPWSLPPAGLRAGAFAAVRGRMRMTGLAPKKMPLAPLTAEILGAGHAPQALHPPPRGLATVIRGGNAGQQTLRLVAYGPGTVTLRHVDVVSRD